MQTKPSRADLWMLLAALAWLALSGYRAWRTDLSLGAYLDCRGCLAWPVLRADLALLGAALAAFVLARLGGLRALAWALALATLALALVFVVDVWVLRLLSRRLFLAEALRYGGEVRAAASVMAPVLREPGGLLVLLGSLGLLLGVALGIGGAARAPRRRAWPWAIAAGLALLAANGPGLRPYLNASSYQNVLALNAPDGMARPYGEATLARLAATPPPVPRCEAGAPAPRPVIVLVVESLSLHHSALFSGLNDWTPRLDALAREGTWFPDFLANGFSTEGGLAALLTGEAPVSTLEHGGVMVLTHVHGDLYRRLDERGIPRRFFTTGDLGFGERVRWLPAIGIRDAEGAEHPAYDGLPRGPFRAATDAALFARLLDWYDRERAPGPFLATVLTVGMHPPYRDRVDGQQGEEGAVRATDAAVAALVDGLRARGFFDEGVLVVVGDHRAMVPVSRAEYARYGEDSMVRVPAFVLGASGLPRGELRGDFQQVDLAPSLAWALGERSCRTPFQGRLLGPAPEPARVALLADPSRLDQVRVRHAGRGHVFVLDGDDSRWRGDAPDPGFDVALEIARLRVERDAAAAASD